jgi:hypothetical protein
MVGVDKIISVTGIRIKYLAKIDAIIIDDIIFTLHYRFTFIVLLVCSILITCEQFFGKPILCIKGGDVPDKLLETFCWIEGTFTLPKALIKAIGKEVPAPGIEQAYEKDEIIEHAYYQWVCVVLFLQGICFYVTHLLWKEWEKGRLKNIISNLNKVILKDEEKKSKEDVLVNYFMTNLGRHGSYAFRYFICEVFNFIHVILQMAFVNYFLGGEFSRYGLDVLKFVDSDPENREDPMAKIFPKLTKCTFRRFGPSGDVMKFDNLCLLPLNILNEKIYILLWFWFYILMILSGFMVLYRILVIAFPRTRYLLLHKLHHLVPVRYLDTILNRVGYGDWFLLYLIGKNLDTMHFRDVIIQLSDKLDALPHNELQDEFDTKVETKV